MHMRVQKHIHRHTLGPGPFLAFAQEAMSVRALDPARCPDAWQLPESVASKPWAFKALVGACCCLHVAAL